MRWHTLTGLALTVLGAVALANHVVALPEASLADGPQASLWLFGLLVLAGLGIVAWGYRDERSDA